MRQNAANVTNPVRIAKRTILFYHGFPICVTFIRIVILLFDLYYKLVA